MNKILCLLLLFSVTDCKQKKEQEINDPSWRKESLEISFNICLKLETCLKEDVISIKKELKNYIRNEISPDKCTEKNKKSRVYFLKGNNSKKIKEVVRDCYSQIQKFTCDEIRSGAIKASISCEEMRRIQQSNSM